MMSIPTKPSKNFQSERWDLAEYIHNHPNLTRKQLRKYTKMHPDDFDEAMRLLIKSNRIEMITIQPNERVNRYSKVWRCTRRCIVGPHRHRLKIRRTDL